MTNQQDHHFQDQYRYPLVQNMNLNSKREKELLTSLIHRNLKSTPHPMSSFSDDTSVPSLTRSSSLTFNSDESDTLTPTNEDQLSDSSRSSPLNPNSSKRPIQERRSVFDEYIQNGKFYSSFCQLHECVSETILVEFTQALISNPQIQVLHLSGSMITPSVATNLARYIRTSTYLSELDISNCRVNDMVANLIFNAIESSSKLTSLCLNSNSIGLSGCRSLSSALQRTHSLKKIWLNQCDIDDAGVAVLSQGLMRRQNSLIELHLEGNKIGNDGANSLAGMLKVNKSLICLDMSHNPITEEGLDALSEALSVNTVIKELSVSKIKGAKKLRNSSSRPQSVVSVENVASTQMDDEIEEEPRPKSSPLAPSSSSPLKLPSPPTQHSNIVPLQQIKRINMSPPVIDSHAMLARNLQRRSVLSVPSMSPIMEPASENQVPAMNPLTEAARRSSSLLRQSSNQSLRSVATFNSTRTSSGTHAALARLSFAQQRAYPMKSLGDDTHEYEDTFIENLPLIITMGDINSNYCRLMNVTEIDLKGLAFVLQKNTTMETLHISMDNSNRQDPFDVSAFSYFFRGLMLNTRLNELSLNNMNITDQAVRYLAKSLTYNNTLRRLKLNDNDITFKGAASIASALVFNSAIEELGLSSNQIGDHGALAMSTMLKRNRAIKQLYLGYNKISDLGARHLAESFEHNTTLEKLNLTGNHISKRQGLKALKYAQMGSKSLREVYVYSDKRSGNIAAPSQPFFKRLFSSKTKQVKFNTPGKSNRIIKAFKNMFTSD